MFLRASKHFYAPSLLTFVACESKSNRTVFPTSLMNKLLFCDISCKFLIMVLITTVPLSLSSNKLVNNFNCDTNLLMPISLLLIFFKKKYYLAIGWLLIITFDVIRSEKCEFQVRYLNKRDFLLTIWHISYFEQKVNSFIKIFKSQFQNPRNLDEKNWFFHNSCKNNFQIHNGTENRLNMLSHHLLGGIIRGTNKTHAFYKQHFLSTQPRCCLTISWTELQVLLKCCLKHTYKYHHRTWSRIWDTIVDIKKKVKKIVLLITIYIFILCIRNFIEIVYYNT